MRFRARGFFSNVRTSRKSELLRCGGQAMWVLCWTRKPAKRVGDSLVGQPRASSGTYRQMLGVPAYIVMPKNAPVVKKNAVLGYGATIIDCAPTVEARGATLAQTVEKTGAYFISPYNDYGVVAGQATASLELLNEVNDLDIVIIPVGGGGLAAGTSLTCHYLAPQIEVLAAEPKMPMILTAHFIRTKENLPLKKLQWLTACGLL